MRTKFIELDNISVAAQVFKKDGGFLKKP